MAEYKVPQNVEADDKLIGPFSFRQFCYLMIAFGGCVMAFFLGKQALPLIIIPAPVILVFGVLALPLRKDQPMEIYMAAMIRYYILKPKVRIWIADGEEPNVKIGAPINEDDIQEKSLKAEEVSQRLSFLANITDTKGWSTRGLDAPAPINHNLNEDFMASAQNAHDIMDGDDSNAEHIDHLLGKSSEDIRSKAIKTMKELENKPASAAKQSQAAPVQTAPQNANAQPNGQPLPMPPTYNYQNTMPPAYQAAMPPMYNPAMPPQPMSAPAQLPGYNYAPPTPPTPEGPETIQVNGAQLSDVYNMPQKEDNKPAPSQPAPVPTSLSKASNSVIINSGSASQNNSDDMINIKLR